MFMFTIRFIIELIIIRREFHLLELKIKNLDVAVFKWLDNVVHNALICNMHYVRNLLSIGKLK